MNRYENVCENVINYRKISTPYGKSKVCSTEKTWAPR